MKNFETYFKDQTKEMLKTSSASLTTYAAVINLINDYRVKEWASLYLFYVSSEKGTRLNPEAKLLVQDYVKKYEDWKGLEKEFKNNPKSMSRDYKPLRNYQMYILAQETKKEVVKSAVETAQKIRTSELAKMLGVSQNVASAFKRGETNRVSYDKILNSKLDLI